MNHQYNQTLIDTIQLNYLNTPLAVFLLGANGSGKSTLRSYLNLTDIQMNIDPDVLNRIYKNFHPANYLFESAKQALNMYKQAINNNFNICIESTLAGHGTIERIKQAKQRGYYIIAYFVGLNDVKLNIQRIKERVAAGGHNIPEDTIKKRYTESIINMQKVYNIFDELYVIDNSHDHYNLQLTIEAGNIEGHVTNIENWAANIVK